jgi:hypothetical protein
VFYASIRLSGYPTPRNLWNVVPVGSQRPGYTVFWGRIWGGLNHRGTGKWLQTSNQLPGDWLARQERPAETDSGIVPHAATGGSTGLPGGVKMMVMRRRGPGGSVMTWYSK